jgi:hypothetical protein
VKPQSEATLTDSHNPFPRTTPTPNPDSTLPRWTWEELELALLCLPLRTPQRLAVPSLVKATRLATPYQTSIATLKELVALISGLGEDFEALSAPTPYGEAARMD